MAKLVTLVCALAAVVVVASGFAAPSSSYAYGSADIGTWQPDVYGLPSFEVSLSNLSRVYANITADTHIVGNDRHITFVAADGMLSMRQDEGGPKLLSDYNVSLSQFGGGVGWLFDDGAEVPICDTNVTYPPLPDRANTLTLGIGYVSKTCASPAAQLLMTQVVWAPFGTIPAVVSTITIRNAGNGASPRLRYLEQWAAGAPVQLINGGVRPQSWNASFEPVLSPSGDVIGVLSRKVNPSGNASLPSADDPSPRPIFFVSLDAAAAGGQSALPSFGVDGDALFPAGSGDRSRTPDLAALINSTAMPAAGWTHGVLALVSPSFGPLVPNESIEVSFVFGYLPDDTTTVADILAAIFALGSGGPQSGTALWNASTALWAASLPLIVDVPALGPWVARETAWHGYMLRALITYDTFRQRYNINQNGEYQNMYLRPASGVEIPPKIGGFNGASRDSLAHVLPFVVASPQQSAVVLDTLKFWLQTQLDSGMLAWGTGGYGLDWRGWVGSTPWEGHVCSDLPVWLLMTAAEYILATRDASFLSHTLVRNATGAQPQSVFSLLMTAFSALMGAGSANSGVGLGVHGLLRILGSDHNDGFSSAIGISYFTPEYNVVNATGESVMASATAAFIFRRFADALTYAGAPYNASAESIDAAAGGLRSAVEAATGTASFVPRAWLGANTSLGWFGVQSGVPDAGGQTDCMWMEPQPWSILAGSLNSTATASVLARVLTHLCDTSPIGCQNMDCCYHNGSCSYAGVVHFSNWPLIWALGSPRVAEPDAALAAFAKNSLAAYASTYPSNWYGITSASDGYVGALYVPNGMVPGGVAYSGSYPHFNAWAHAEPLCSATHALGIWFVPEGVVLVGGMLNATEYTFNSSVVSLGRKPGTDGGAVFSGRYEPYVAGEWMVQLFLPAALRHAYARVQVNGACVPVTQVSGGLQWSGAGGGAAGPLTWVLGAC